MYKVKFADIGEGLTEGKVVEVLVKVGDVVKAGDSLFFVETDKVNSEIPAPVNGKIAKILIKADQEIKVGDVVMEIDEQSSTTKTENEKSAKSQSSQTEVKPTSAQKVEEENASVVGSTPVSNDVIQRNQQSTKTSHGQKTVVKATPLARKMAKDLNLDLTQITPTGPGGRILVSNLKQSAQLTNKKSQGEKASSTSFTNVKIPSTIKIPSTNFINPDVKVEFEVKSMTGIRKAIVKAMTLSHQKMAEFTGFKNIDVTPTVNVRAQLKNEVEAKGIKLTYLAFIVKAVCQALQEMPNINVQIDEEKQAIKYIKNINIGIAVDTPEGLIVPVIKQANQLSVLEIAVAINELATKAKNKKLTLKDISEGTFTISNFGSVGLEYATPIINAPESAILGVGMMNKSLAYVDNEIQSRMMMPFSMTADHRVIDGADVGRFLQKIETYLKNPLILLN